MAEEIMNSAAKGGADHREIKEWRRHSLYMAGVAEEAERYEDMVGFMREVVSLAGMAKEDLSKEERSKLSAAYKQVASRGRATCRMMATLEAREEGNEQHVAIVRRYRVKAEAELAGLCRRVLELLDGHRSHVAVEDGHVDGHQHDVDAPDHHHHQLHDHDPHIDGQHHDHDRDDGEHEGRDDRSGDERQHQYRQGVCWSGLLSLAASPESKVFLLKMKGDYHRYLAEIQTGHPRQVSAEQARLAYESAQEIAAAHLSPIDVLRLSLVLNLSVFYYEILNLQDRACNLAKQAIEEASEHKGTLEDEYPYKDVINVLQLLRDNIVLWSNSTDSQEETTDNLVKEFNKLAPV